MPRLLSKTLCYYLMVSNERKKTVIITIIITCIIIKIIIVIKIMNIIIFIYLFTDTCTLGVNCHCVHQLEI